MAHTAQARHDGGVATERAGGEVSFAVTETAIEGVPVVSVKGEVDVSTAPELNDRLERVRPAHGTIVVDMTDVTFVDSTGLGVLVTALHGRRDQGGDLRLVITDPHISKVMDITGLNEVFSVFRSPADAVKS